MAKIIQILETSSGALLGLGDDGNVYDAFSGEWSIHIAGLPKTVTKRGPQFNPPSCDEVVFAMEGRGLNKHEAMAEGSKFFNHYESNGWKVGKNKMKDWNRAVSGWVTRWRENNEKNRQSTRSAVDRVAAANGINADFTRSYKGGHIQALGFDD